MPGDLVMPPPIAKAFRRVGSLVDARGLVTPHPIPKAIPKEKMRAMQVLDSRG